jgi:hypothetical protein
MRQQYRTNVPEQSATGQYQVQMKGDKWHVFDGKTGGWSKTAHDTYKGANAEADSLHGIRQAEAAAAISNFHLSRNLNGNPA